MKDKIITVILLMAFTLAALTVLLYIKKTKPMHQSQQLKAAAQKIQTKNENLNIAKHELKESIREYKELVN